MLRQVQGSGVFGIGAVGTPAEDCDEVLNPLAAIYTDNLLRFLQSPANQLPILENGDVSPQPLTATVVTGYDYVDGVLIGPRAVIVAGQDASTPGTRVSRLDVAYSNSGGRR